MEDKQTEKRIAQCIQTIQVDQQEARELISSIDCALTRMAYKETQPDAKEEKVRTSPKEPENITEALEYLVENGKNIRGLLQKLSSRADSLF